MFVFPSQYYVYCPTELPAGAVDMIVNALDSHVSVYLREQAWYGSVVEWANNSRAPALAIDPPVRGTPINTKWALGVVLPLPLPECSNMQEFLCDQGIPQKVFHSVGIQYKSPFAHKFVIPIHRKA